MPHRRSFSDPLDKAFEVEQPQTYYDFLVRKFGTERANAAFGGQPDDPFIPLDPSIQDPSFRQATLESRPTGMDILRDVFIGEKSPLESIFGPELREARFGLSALSRGAAENVGEIIEELEKFTGVARSPFAEGPITEAQERVIPTELEPAALAARTAGRFYGGIAGFGVGLPAAILEPEVGLERELKPGETAGSARLAQEFQGLREIVGSPLIAIDWLIQNQLQGKDPEQIADAISPNAPLSRLYQAITGNQLNPMRYRQAVNELFEAPETPLFGKAIGGQVLKGAARLGGRVGRKVGLVAKPEPTIAEQVLPTREQLMANLEQGLKLEEATEKRAERAVEGLLENLPSEQEILGRKLEILDNTEKATGRATEGFSRADRLLPLIGAGIISAQAVDALLTADQDAPDRRIAASEDMARAATVGIGAAALGRRGKIKPKGLAPMFFSRSVRQLESRFSQKKPIPVEAFDQTLQTMFRKGEISKEEARLLNFDELRSKGLKRKNAENPKGFIEPKELKEHLEKNDIQVEEVLLEDPKTQYNQYATAGGQNYRELLFKLPPSAERKALDAFLKPFLDPRSDRAMTTAERQQYAKLIQAERWTRYQGPHFGGEPTLAHTRMSDFVDEKGKKTLMVEEVQSDLHQEAARVGYRGEVRPPTGAEMEAPLRAQEQIADMQEAYGVVERQLTAIRRTPRPEDMLGGAAREVEIAKLQDQLKQLDIETTILEYELPLLTERAQPRLGEGGPAEAPFRKNWAEFVIRRTLRLAAEEGYVCIAWTTGEAQIKRYSIGAGDIAAQIRYEPYRGVLTVLDRRGNEILHRDNVTRSDVQKLLGEKTTESLLDMENFSHGEYHQFGISQFNLDASTLGDIKIEGTQAQGLLKFYDQDLPTFLEKYGRAFETAPQRSSIFVSPESRVARGRAHFGLDLSSVPAWTFKIPKQLKDDVLFKGQPKFGRTLAGIATGAIIFDQLKQEDQDQILASVPEALLLGTLGFSKKSLNRVRKSLGFEELSKPQRVRWTENLIKAKQAGLDMKADRTVADVIASERPMSATEQAGVGLRIAQLGEEYTQLSESGAKFSNQGRLKEAAGARLKRTATMENIEKLTEGMIHGRSEAARATAFGRAKLDLDDYSMAGIVRDATALKGRRLSPEETVEFETFGKEHARLLAENKRLHAENDKLAGQREQADAAKVAAHLARQRRAETKTEAGKKRLKTERDDIKSQLAAIGFRVNDITGVTAEGAFLVGKLATNYIKSGITDMKSLVERVRNDLPELSDSDVYRSLLAKNPKIQAKARKKADRDVTHLKRQADLLIKIEDAKEGVFEKPKQKNPTIPEIKELQDQLAELRQGLFRAGLEKRQIEHSMRTIDELQDQLKNQHRPIKEKKPLPSEEVAALKDNIKKLRRQMRIDDAISNLEEQLRTNDFEVPPKPTRDKLSPPLIESEVKLKTLRRKVRARQQDMAPMTPARKFQEVINTMRTMKATADMSAVLRQSLPLVIPHPIKGGQAFAKSLKTYFSENSATEIDFYLKNASHHWVREGADLHFSETGGPPTLREEFFSSQLAEKIPVWGEVVKGSARHMTTYLNLLRASIFDDFYFKNPNATTVELKAYADYINVTSGRGNLGSLGKSGKFLSAVFFAPRFAASRVQTPYMLYKHWKHPRVRKLIAKDLALTYGVGLTTLYLAHLAGAGVGLDPNESDWGQVRIGDTRFDIWGGLQQSARLVGRIGMIPFTRAGVAREHLKESEKDVNPIALLGQFVGYKLSPALTLPNELLTGKNMVGEERTITESLARSVLPIIVEEIEDAWRQDGVGAGAAAGGAAFFGVGANTFPDSETRVRRDIRKSLLKGDIEGAIERQTEWNTKNPDNEIAKTGLGGAEKKRAEREIRAALRDENRDEALKAVRDHNKIWKGTAFEIDTGRFTEISEDITGELSSSGQKKLAEKEIRAALNAGSVAAAKKAARRHNEIWRGTKFEISANQFKRLQRDIARRKR